jgi:hypothetical protein
MEQIVIKVESDNTSSAIKNFVSQFSDASIENMAQNDDNYFMETYGINKQEFENRVNTGIAQSVLGITQPWNEVKEELRGKINKNEED